MSAWPEAVYVINKFNTSMDAWFDIRDNQNPEAVAALNDRIDALNLLVNKPTDPNKGISPTQTEILNLLNDLNVKIEAFEEDYDDIVEQLDGFEEDLDEAMHTIVFIGTQQPSDAWVNSVWLIEEV